MRKVAIAACRRHDPRRARRSNNDRMAPSCDGVRKARVARRGRAAAGPGRAFADRKKTLASNAISNLQREYPM